MKTLFTLFTILVFTNTTFGQFEYFIDFDSPDSQNNSIIIDYVTNPDNIWQIGIPQKPVFESAYSLTHAIVTDTINSYPINDTSFFILKHVRPGELGGNESLQLNFWFKMNTDSLTDYGKVEASIDNGNIWIDLLTEDITYGLYWIGSKPVLTGNSNGWQHFALELSSLTYTLGYSDTLLYRFTFISDNEQTNKDGWMLDDFQLADWWEGIDEHNNNDKIILYPNPTHGEVTIINNIKEVCDYSLEIIANSGKTVLKQEIHSNHFILDLPSGFYTMKLNDKENIYLKKFIVKK